MTPIPKLRVGFWLIGLAVALFGFGCSTAPKPIRSSEIYDPSADGEVQMKTALARARKEQKLLLLDLGANWCSDSQAMYRLLTSDPALKREIREHYLLTLIDVNDRDGANRNQTLLHRLNSPLTRGIPMLLILKPDGTVLNTDATERLSDDSHIDPARVLAYLQKWARRP